MIANSLQSSLIEKGLLFCGYGGMALSALVGLLGLVGAGCDYKIFENDSIRFNIGDL